MNKKGSVITNFIFHKSIDSIDCFLELSTISNKTTTFKTPHNVVYSCTGTYFLGLSNNDTF